MGIRTDAKIAFGINLGRDEDHGIDTEMVWDILDQRKDVIEIEHHCSDGEEHHALIVRGSLIVAHRGYPVAFDPNMLQSYISRDFRRVCKEFGFEYSSPRWLLFSWWG